MHIFIQRASLDVSGTILGNTEYKFLSSIDLCSTMERYIWDEIRDKYEREKVKEWKK